MRKFLEQKIEFLFNNPNLLGAKLSYKKEDIDFVLKTNLIILYCAFICGIASVYYLLILENIDALIYIITTIMMLISFYINEIKHLYFSKFVSIFIVNLALLLVCVFFKRSEFYVFCFFITIYVTNILFSYKKLSYIIILTIQCILCIFIVHFFNGNILLHQNLEKNILSNFLFLIIMFSGITIIAAKINYLKDVEYLKDKAKLFKINKSLIKINTEIDQLNVAALHSMKTPLYVAEDFIKQLHKNAIAQNENFDSQEYITLINNSIHLSEMYVQNLFIYDAIITNTITYEYFNVLEKIKFVLEIATKKASNVSITVDCNDFMVHTNEFCFLVILENLITNGLKYNNSDRKTLTISARKNRYETVVRITDNGIGIEPIYFDRVFFPFVRINQNIQVDGTGLGLSSVKIAASKINGNVKIVESSKKGTTFEFNFKNN